jgi:hypothetical protein
MRRAGRVVVMSGNATACGEVCRERNSYQLILVMSEQRVGKL